MATDWPRASFGAICEHSAFGPRFAGEHYSANGNVAILRTTDISADGRISYNTMPFARLDLERFHSHLLRPGDIVITRSGRIGTAALFGGFHLPVIPGAFLIRFRLRQDIADARFYTYFFNSPEGQDLLLSTATGSVQQNLNITSVHALEVPVPPISEQRCIAHILGVLDDKFDLNRWMSQTLEAMARELFKSWFVDFDPVRAKAEGRDPGLPRSITHLFPSRFVESELGEIPEGWEVGTLGDVLCQRVERCEASSETAARPYVPIECISSRSLCLIDSKSGEQAQSSLTKFHKYDLLFGAMRPYFHKVCIAPFDGTTRTTVFVLRPKRSTDFAFATFLLYGPETIDFATRHSTGSTIPYAVWANSMELMPALLPPVGVRAAFNSMVQPILSRITQPYFESGTLAALRDALLPKLATGELRVTDVDNFQRTSEP